MSVHVSLVWMLMRPGGPLELELEAVVRPPDMGAGN